MSTLYSDRLTPEEVASEHRALFADLGEGASDRQKYGARGCARALGPGVQRVKQILR